MSVMIRKKFFVVYLAILLCLSSVFAQAHTYKITVIVDTDMALDDMRALAMLLNSDMLDIPLIVTSDGSTSHQAGCRNLGTLLHYFKRQDIKIAQGRDLGKPPPSWRSLSENVKWPEPLGVPGKVSADQAAPAEIVNTLESLDEDVLYLCLGPLTNLAEALRLNPEIKERISRLIYYGGHQEDPGRVWGLESGIFFPYPGAIHPLLAGPGSSGYF